MNKENINSASTTGGLPLAPSIAPALEAENMTSQKAVVSKRILYIAALAIGEAIVIGFIAKFLVLLIEIITNLCFHGTFSSENASPVGNHLGLFVIAVPVLGSIVVGIMARYGSKAIRGHGIPEAMEQVLTNESRIKPSITFLKPLSSAVAIGTGGPFGAEGPIIATGGALGSLVGQILKTSADERKVLLTAGATAGMAAIFGSPVAAVLLAIELLLFEFSPRSIIPVALACATGAGMHWILFNAEPFFKMEQISAAGGAALATYAVLGAFIGVMAALTTKIVYAIEDAFEKLPVHWMWWPAIGGLAVGIIGYFAPNTMGVGYDNIKVILSGSATLQVLLVLCILKFLSWSIALGSGTSGGTLAPLFTIGGAMGALVGIALATYLPQLGIDPRIAALVGMAAIFAGASRALLTSIVFAFETTQQPDALLPLLAGCTVAYLVSFFLMKHTIMTEKIARRGVNTPHSYVPDVLDATSIEEIATRNVRVLNGNNTIAEVKKWIESGRSGADVSCFPVVNDEGVYMGTVSFKQIYNVKHNPDAVLLGIINHSPVTIYEDNSLRIAVDLMVKENIDVLAVVDRNNKDHITGIVTHRNILEAYRLERENEVATQSISLKGSGIKMVLLGRSLLRHSAKTDA